MSRRAKLEPKKLRNGRWQLPVTPELSLTGGRQRPAFDTKGEALAYATALRDRQAAALIEDREMTFEERRVAWEATKLCRVHGLNLLDLTRAAVARAEAAAASITFDDLAARVIADKAAKGKSSRHLAAMRWQLAKFGRTFGARKVNTITGKEIEDWMMGEGIAGVSWNNFRRYLRLTFRYGVKLKVLTASPTEDVDQAAVADAEVEAFTVPEARAMLAAATPDMVPAIALGFFAGVRPAEVLRMHWRDIHWPEGTAAGDVEVVGRKSKTGQRRLVRMEPVLAAWLAAYRERPPADLIFTECQTAYYQGLEALKAAAGLTRWVHDGLRHSFCSYHLAHFNDLGALVSYMGHRGSGLIFSNYRRVVKPADAAAYWQLFPAVTATP